MRCEQVGEMMSAHLDGRLGSTEITLLGSHLAGCSACRDQWRRLRALEDLLRSAPMLRPPAGFRGKVAARLKRRERARRAAIGSTALLLGTVALMLLAVAVAFAGLLRASGMAFALVSGGPETVVQLLALVSALARTVLVLAGKFGTAVAVFGLASLALALVLDGLWLGAVHRLRAAQ